MVPDQALVRSIEERLLKAWPALQTLLIDGWIFGSYTKRANSTNAVWPGADLDHVISAGSEFYLSGGAVLATLQRWWQAVPKSKNWEPKWYLGSRPVDNH